MQRFDAASYQSGSIEGRRSLCAVFLASKSRFTWGGRRSSGRSCPCRTPPTAPVASTGGGKDNVQHEVIELLLVMGLAKGVAGSKGRSVYANLMRGLSA